MRAALAALFLLLPFEPVRPLVSAGGLGFTLLELAAAAATLVLVAARPRPLLRLVARPPAALACLLGFAAWNLVAARLAPAYVHEATVFALRMAAAALFAFVVAAAPAGARRAALAALTVSALAVALLALGEAIGLARLDPVLDLFRERVFDVDGPRRATAGSAGPNAAAALLAAGLIAGVGLLRGRLGRTLAVAVPLALGLAATWSRGGWAAALLGLAVLALTRRGDARRAAAVAAAVLALVGALALLRPAFRGRVAAEVREQRYAGTVDVAEPELRLTPGETRTLRVRLENRGREAWRPEERATLHVFLHRWPGRDEAAVWRRPLPAALEPGATTTLDVPIAAPEAGTYVLVCDLFSLPSGFLGAAGSPPRLVPVGVGAPPPDPSALAVSPHAWSRGRLELWRIALVMWRAHPWTGVGPDNFRRLNARYGGWFRGGNYPMNAHDAFLEAAATTGTPGLVLLAATLALALLSAARASRGPLAGIVTALLAAVLVQATVESLLAYTAHYLLFAFLVGAAAVPAEDED